VLQLRRKLQDNAQRLQSEEPIPDFDSESDELFQNAEEKGDEHFDPLDPPRRRANKRRGRGTYVNDRPPVLGVIGRESGQVRLRVVEDTKASNWKNMSMLSRGRIAMSTPMSTTVTMALSALARVWNMASRNGHVMMTAMASERFTPTPLKACGLAYAISCVPFEGSTRNTSQAMSLSTNAGSI